MISDMITPEKIDWLWRLSLAQIFTVFIFTLSFVDFPTPLPNEVRPYFILMVLYYWAVHRPSFLKPVYIFILGFVFDLVLGFPTGLHALLFIFIYWLVKQQRLFLLGQSYFAVWIGFTLVSFTTLLFEWAFFSLFTFSFIPYLPLISSFIMTILIFPFVTILLNGVLRLLPVAEKSYGP